MAGGLGSFGKSHPTIRMVSEDLRINVTDQDSANVDVLFTFRNEGKATDVTMAFPEEYQMREGRSLDNFRSWVNGKPSRLRRKVLSVGDPQAEDKGDEIGKAVWLKNVHFSAGEVLKIRVSYEGFLSGNTSDDRSFTYTLVTGGTWKGPIGKCKITVTWPRMKELSAPFLNLPPAKWTYLPGRKAVTTLTNWEPKHNLQFEMFPGFGNYWIDGKRVSHQDAHEEYHVITLGALGDPMIRSVILNSFLPADLCGGAFSVSKGVLQFASGHTFKLPRGYKVIKTKNSNDDRRDNEFVYLKDVVEAFGGTLQYDPILERTNITLGNP